MRGRTFYNIGRMAAGNEPDNSENWGSEGNSKAVKVTGETAVNAAWSAVGGTLGGPVGAIAGGLIANTIIGAAKD
ncbi:hypothetical protein RYZ27_14375 [Hyphomonas sp. FCG-A18]|uniref:hypothetical protein n=1 Tax=Hyphomonas sp. FCG-A18 TaxID=3080019 RepID=UPI002B2FBB48|nr:hypothetical protein RYZ27_14375 [Hyphomonas sp. FCG-A18]